MTEPKKTGIFASLDPIDRISEAIFGIIMTLTFTSVMTIANGSNSSVTAVLRAAFSCNLAWGLIDALMYCVTSYVEKGRSLFRFRTLAARPEAEARLSVMALLRDKAGVELTEEQASAAMESLHTEASRSRTLGLEDIKGAIGVFIIAATAGLPISLPFLVLDDLRTALHVSNALGVLLLFFAGFALGRQMGGRGWTFGTVFAIAGSLLTAVTIALGG